MLSSVVEKRIEDISTISNELRHIVPRDGWTDYAIGLLSRLQKLSIILDDEDEDAEARLDEVLSGFNSDDGNTRLPFGLCEREGIKIDPSWTPRDAWAALEKKGYNVSETYNELKETGSVGPRGESGHGGEEQVRFRSRAINDKIRAALKSEPNQLVLFSGCHRRDENGKISKKSPEVAREYAKNNGGVTMEMLLENDEDAFSDWNYLDMDKMSQWEEGSRALAEQASGDVRVITKVPPRSGSIFDAVEFPALKNNKEVTSVVAIDPDTGEKTVLFRR